MGLNWVLTAVTVGLLPCSTPHGATLQVTASWTSLVCHSHEVFASPEDIDPDVLGPQQTKLMHDLIEQLDAFRAHHPELSSQFYDVDFASLIAQPTEVARGIYQYLGLGQAPDLSAFLAENKRQRTQVGPHVYRRADRKRSSQSGEAWPWNFKLPEVAGSQWLVLPVAVLAAAWSVHRWLA